MFSYLTSANYDFQYDRQHNVRPRRNIRMALQHGEPTECTTDRAADCAYEFVVCFGSCVSTAEISMYAISQKEGVSSAPKRECVLLRLLTYNHSLLFVCSSVLTRPSRTASTA